MRALLSGGVLLSILGSCWIGMKIDDDPGTEGVVRALTRPWQVVALICLVVLLIAVVRRTLFPAA